MQSRKRSFQEIATGTVLGFFGSLAITYTVLNVLENKAVIAWTTVILCTAWSLLRGYSIRRWFAKRDGLHYSVSIDARNVTPAQKALRRLLQDTHYEREQPQAPSRPL